VRKLGNRDLSDLFFFYFFCHRNRADAELGEELAVAEGV
jgi:hypothetical protein